MHRIQYLIGESLLTRSTRIPHTHLYYHRFTRLGVSTINHTPRARISLFSTSFWKMASSFSRSRLAPGTGATASRIYLTRTRPGEYSVGGISEESARTASRLLQENHEKHHIFFNKSGFHSECQEHRCLTVEELGHSPYHSTPIMKLRCCCITDKFPTSVCK